ncbi:MAG: PAS domain-containing protein [Rhodospirillales bacterium]
MLGRVKSIQGRFFFFFLPPVLIATVSVVLLHGFFAYETLREEFFRKQEDIVFNNSIALVEPMTRNDVRRVNRILEIITTDPDVLFAQVKDLTEKTIAETGPKESRARKGVNTVSGVITDVIAADADWEVLGALYITFSTKRILDAIREQVLQNALLIFLLMGVVVLCAFLVVKFLVAKPLKALSAKASFGGDEAYRRYAAEPAPNEVDAAVGLCERLLARVNALEDGVAAGERRLRVVLETSPAGVVIATRDGRGLFCNARYAEQYGGSREEVLSINPHLNYADSRDRDRLYACLAENGRVDAMDIRMRRKDGSLWWARCTWLPVEFEDKLGHIGWLLEIDPASATVDPS